MSNIGRPSGPAYSTYELLNTPLVLCSVYHDCCTVDIQETA